MANNKNKPLILIVDDDDITRLTLRKVLEKETDYQLIEARNGIEALEQFKKHQPDMVLMDVMMPEINGYEACHAIRKISDEDTTPIMMLTGLNDIDAIEQAFYVGATDFITKPINWPILAQRVRYAMRTSELYVDSRKKQLQLSHAQHIAKLGYFEYNKNTHSFTCSEELLNIFNIDADSNQLSFNQFIHAIPASEQEYFIESIDTAISENIHCEFTHHLISDTNKDRIVKLHGEPILDENKIPYGIAGTIQDITERKQAEALIQLRTYYDTITELPNRFYLSKQLGKLMQQAETNNHTISIILFHLDRFREINDTLGHRIGDQLLRIIAKQFSHYFRDEAIFARFDGATFALILNKVRSVDETIVIAEKILDMLAQPYIVHEHEVFISGSIGITLHPDGATDKETLLKNADTAMSLARKSGGNQYQFFSSEMNTLAEQRLQLETDLRKALDRNEFRVYYQPQFDCQTRKIIGMEALIRWIHPVRGIVSPLEFIPIAEETNLIMAIGEWVMKTAMAQTKLWHQQGHPLRIGVNLSAIQFTDKNLIANIEKSLKETGLAPEYLDFEVTESIAMDDFNTTLNILHKIKSMGIRISIDDFGTGHSSLGYLQRMPVNTIKIDRAFIKNIGNGDDGTLAKAIIAMAHSMDLNVIAEGIEIENHYDFLKLYKCN